MIKRSLPWILILAVVIVVSIIKIHLLYMPLERDEGEYAYIAQLLMRGEPLYISAYSMKLPAVYFAYAAIMSLFGQSSYSIHLGLLLINAVAIILIFLLTRRLLGSYAGVVAGTSLALLTLGKYALAFNIEHLVVLSVLFGSLALLSALDRGRGFLLSGAIFGLGFIAKQHALIFILFGAFYIVWFHLSPRLIAIPELLKRIGLFLAGAAAPFIVVCLYIYTTGAFGAFRFWAFEYAARYCALTTFSDGVSSFFYIAKKIIGSSPLIWAVSGIGSVAARKSVPERKSIVFIAGLFIASFLAITPGLYFRHHYFILLFPSVAIFTGIAANYMRQNLSVRPVPGPRRDMILTAAFIAVFGLSIFHQERLLFRMSPIEAVGDIYKISPVVESVEIAKYIEDNSAPGSRVIVFGSEPQIYFYLRKAAPVKYIYMYPLLEDTPYAGAMQKGFRKEAEAAKADYVICVNSPTSWFNGRVNGKVVAPLFEWVNTYPRKYYDVVGAVDMISRGKSVYVWGENAKDYRLKSDQYIVIFKRKADIGPA